MKTRISKSQAINWRDCKCGCSKSVYEEMNRAFSERDHWKEQATQRRGLVESLRKEMGIKPNLEDDTEIKQALDFISRMKGGIFQAIQKCHTDHSAGSQMKIANLLEKLIS